MAAVETTSLKKIASNRCNARKSTGPNTPRGRAVSKMNALKHGILSRQVLVRGVNFHESGRALATLHQRFWRQLMPVGPLEEMLVDQIVTVHWRLGRVLKAESGEIALSVDEGQWQRTRVPRTQLLELQWQAAENPVTSMQDSTVGTGLLEKLLGELRKDVEQAGEMTETAINEISRAFGGKPNFLTRGLEQLRLQCLENPQGLDEAALRERNQQQILAWLDKQLNLLFWRKEACEKRETTMEESRQAAAVLPAMPVLDKILRYETKLHRQLFRAMTHLERLQRIRRGETVPPPLTMELSERP